MGPGPSPEPASDPLSLEKLPGARNRISVSLSPMFLVEVDFFLLCWNRDIAWREFEGSFNRIP